MKNAMTKTSSHNLAPKGGTKAMVLGNLQIKSVMLADLGDGCYTDDSVKIKPNTNGIGLVLKCVNKARLLRALAQAGFDPAKVRIQKGSKHYIAFLTSATKNTTLALVK